MEASEALSIISKIPRRRLPKEEREAIEYAIKSIIDKERYRLRCNRMAERIKELEAMCNEWN